MVDYSKYETAEAVPEATSLIETFRAIGYSLPTAVADIVDNSISASSRNIWIDFVWEGYFEERNRCNFVLDMGP